MTRFSVIVPFDPVVHEDLDSRVFTQLPDSDLASGLVLRGGSDGYTLQLVVDAESPGAAKRAGVEAAERFFSVLATWNHGFQARFAGVRSERIEEPESASVAQSAPGVFTVSASDTLFVEAHVEAVVRKANLEAEGDVLDRYANLPEYARSSLELNYLLVLSTRPPNRWLLAAIGLEALTVGAPGPQQTLASQLGPDKDRQLQAVLRTALHVSASMTSPTRSASGCSRRRPIVSPTTCTAISSGSASLTSRPTRSTDGGVSVARSPTATPSTSTKASSTGSSRSFRPRSGAASVPSRYLTRPGPDQSSACDSATRVQIASHVGKGELPKYSSGMVVS